MIAVTRGDDGDHCQPIDEGAPMAHDPDEETIKKQRAPIDGSREDALGEEDEGVSLSVPSYADTGGVSDLGVDEPVVPKDAQGEHVADQPELPLGTIRRPSD
jgi:hypothetical protein